MKSRVRILTPEGEILKALSNGPKSPINLTECTPVARATVYTNLKDLLLVGWVREENGKYYITVDGVKAFWSRVLPDEVDVDRLLKISKELSIPISKLVILGLRLIVDLLEVGRVPSDLGYLLVSYDPGLLDEIVSIIRRGEEGSQAEAEVKV